MKLIPWVIAGMTAAAILHILQSNQRQDAFPIESVTDDLLQCGVRQCFGGGLQEAGGSLKRAASGLIGDEELGIEGIVDEIAGNIKVSAGKAAQVVRYEIRD
jgi:uncharacterized protein YjbJ (UPF0337 family)